MKKIITENGSNRLGLRIISLLLVATLVLGQRTSMFSATANTVGEGTVGQNDIHEPYGNVDDPEPIADFESGRDSSDGTDSDGSDGAGADNDGSDGTGSDGAGTDGTGSDDTGSDGAGTDGTGTDGTGSDGTGSDGTGSDGAVTDGTGTDGAVAGDPEAGDPEAGGIGASGAGAAGGLEEGEQGDESEIAHQLQKVVFRADPSVYPSGQSVTLRYALTTIFSTSQGDYEHEDYLEAGQLKFVTMIPKNSQRLSVDGAGVIDYEFMDSFTPADGNLVTADEGYTFMVMTFRNQLDSEEDHPGVEVDMRFFQNSVTDDSTNFTLKFDAYYRGEKVERDDEHGKPAVSGQTMDMTVTAQNFAWEQLKVSFPDGQHTFDTLPASNSEPPTAANPFPRKDIVSPITLTYSSKPVYNLNTYGHVNTQSVEVKDTFIVPTAEDGTPLLLMTLDELKASLGDAYVEGSAKTFPVGGVSYVTEFSVSMAQTNPNAGVPNNNGVGNDISFSGAITIPQMKINFAKIDTMPIKPEYLTLYSDYKGVNDPGSATGGKEVPTASLPADQRGTATSAFRVAGGTLSDGKAAVSLVNAIQSVIYVKLEDPTPVLVGDPPTIKKTFVKGSTKDENGVAKADPDKMNAAGDTAEFEISGFKNTFTKPVASYIVEDTGYNLAQMYPVKITTGVYQVNKNLAGGTDPSLITPYTTSAAGEFTIILTHEDGTEQRLTSYALGDTPTTITLSEWSQTPEKIKSVKWDFGPLAGLVEPKINPTITFKACEGIVQETSVGSIDFNNKAILDYKDPQDVAPAKKPEDTASVPYVFQPIDYSANNKKVENITNPGKTYNTVGDILKYTITVNNKSGSDLTGLKVIDMYGTRVKPVKVTGTTATDFAKNVDAVLSDYSSFISISNKTKAPGVGDITNVVAVGSTLSKIDPYKAFETAALATAYKAVATNKTAFTTPYLSIDVDGTLKDGESYEITYYMQVTTSGTITNEFHAFGYPPGDGPGPGTRPLIYIGGGKRDTSGVTAPTKPNITIAKTAAGVKTDKSYTPSATALRVGDVVQFKVVVKNNTANSDTLNINVENFVDLMPADTDGSYYEFDKTSAKIQKTGGSATAVAEGSITVGTETLNGVAYQKFIVPVPAGVQQLEPTKELILTFNAKLLRLPPRAETNITTALDIPVNTAYALLKEELAAITGPSGRVGADTDNIDVSDSTKSRVWHTVVTKAYDVPGSKGRVEKIRSAGSSPLNLSTATTEAALTRTYQLRVYNYGTSDLTVSKVLDQLPVYEKYKPGTAKVYTLNQGTTSVTGAPSYTIPDPHVPAGKDDPDYDENDKYLVFTNMTQSGATYSPGLTVKAIEGSGTTAYRAYVIEYQTVISDRELAIKEIQALNSNTFNTANTASFYFEAGKIALSTTTNCLEKDETKTVAWDNDSATQYRYETSVAVVDSVNRIIPDVRVKTQFIEAQGSNYVWSDYNSDAPNPAHNFDLGGYIGWKATFSNLTGATLAMQNPILVVELPENVRFMEGEFETGKKSVTIASNTATGITEAMIQDYQVVINPENGKTLLIWDFTGKNVSFAANKAISLNIMTRATGKSYGSITANAYLIPQQTAEQSFFNADIKAPVTAAVYDLEALKAGNYAGTSDTDGAHFVYHADRALVVGAIGVSSKKTITELNPNGTLTSNTTDSGKPFPRTITINDTDILVQYKLEVSNKSALNKNYFYDKLTFIDRLPASSNDRSVIGTKTNDRGGKAEVDLAANPDFKVYLDGVQVPETDYEITYSNAVNATYGLGDWGFTGNTAGNWSGTPMDDATAFRIVYTNPAGLKSGSALSVTYNAKLRADTYQEGAVAINSFGYGLDVMSSLNPASPAYPALILEPAEVCVKALGDKVVINKSYTSEVSTDRTFWFKLFRKASDGTLTALTQAIPVEVTSSDKNLLTGNTEITGLPKLGAGQSYVLIELADQNDPGEVNNNPELDPAYLVDGQIALDDDSPRTVTRDDSSTYSEYSFTAYNKAEQTLNASIVKTVDTAPREDTEFKFEFFNKDDVTPANPDPDALESYTVKVEAGATTSGVIDISDILKPGINYGIREVATAGNDYTVDSIEVIPDDISKQSPNTYNWEFKAHNLARKAMGSLTKTLSFEAGKKPAATSFDFELQYYDEATSSWEFADDINITFTETDYSGGNWVSPSVDFPLDPYLEYRIVEKGTESTLVWDSETAPRSGTSGKIDVESDGRPEFDVVYAANEQVDDNNTRVWTFSYSNSQTTSSASISIVKNVDLNGLEEPTIKEFEFELYSSKDNYGARIGDVITLTVQKDASGNWNSLDAQGKPYEFDVEPGYDYKVKEINKGTYKFIGDSGNDAGETWLALTPEIKSNHYTWKFEATNVEHVATAQIKKTVVTGDENIGDKTFTFNLYEVSSPGDIIATTDVTVGKDNGWTNIETFKDANGNPVILNANSPNVYAVSEAGVDEETDTVVVDDVTFINTNLGYTSVPDAQNNTLAFTFEHKNTAQLTKGTITKILNDTDADPLYKFFTIGIFEKGNDKEPVRTEVVEVKKNEDGKWEFTTEEFALENGKDYYVKELAASKDNTALATIEGDAQLLKFYEIDASASFTTDGATGRTDWTFTVTNSRKRTTVEIIKALTISGNEPIQDTFTIDLTAREGNQIREVSSYTLNVVKDPATGEWSQTTGLIDVDPRYTYSVEERGASSYRANGYTVSAKGNVSGQGTNHVKWTFTVTNVEPYARTAQASITKVLNTNYSDPDRTFGFYIMETKDNVTRVFGSYSLTVVQTASNRYQNTTQTIRGLDPDATYTIVEQDRQNLVNQGYSIQETASYTGEGTAIKQWTFTVTNTRNTGGGGGSGGSGGGGGGIGRFIRDGSTPTSTTSLVSINDGDVPLSTITDNEVPLTTIPESNVPLANLPITGRNLAAILGSTGLLLLGLTLVRRKKYE